MAVVKADSLTDKHREIARGLKSRNELTGRGNNVDLTRRRVDFVRENISATGRRFSTIVDVGCGDGSFCRALADLGDRICGIQPTPEEVEATRQVTRANGEELEVMQGLSTALPFPDGSVDLVLCNAVLLGFDSDLIDQSLREFARVQQPGSLLYVGEIPEVAERKEGTHGPTFFHFFLWALMNKRPRDIVSHTVRYIRGRLGLETYIMLNSRQFHEDKALFRDRLDRQGYETLAVFESSTNAKIALDGNTMKRRLDYLCVRK